MKSWTSIGYVRDDPNPPDNSGEVPKLNGVVGGSISDCEIVSLLDGKLATWSSASYVIYIYIHN